MNAQTVDQLFVESYMMINLEITFAGVRSWFDMAGSPLDDVTLFKALLFPENVDPSLQSELTLMLVYRYEDVFFQVNRMDESEGAAADPERDNTDPVHQLLLKTMNIRMLRGTADSLIDLGLSLRRDELKEYPQYPSLHGFFLQV